VVHNNETQLWACCGVDENGGVDCNNPTRETFEAEAPEAMLKAVSSSDTTSTSSSATSSIATQTTVTGTRSSSVTTMAPAAASSTSNTPPLSELSENAQKTLGVGLGSGVFGALTILVAYVAWRTHKNSQKRRIDAEIRNSLARRNPSSA
jgi:hypothetical protein